MKRFTNFIYAEINLAVSGRERLLGVAGMALMFFMLLPELFPPCFRHFRIAYFALLGVSFLYRMSYTPKQSGLESFPSSLLFLAFYIMTWMFELGYAVEHFFFSLILLISFSYVLYYLGFSREASAASFTSVRILLIIASYFFDNVIDRSVLDAIIVSMLYDAFIEKFAVVVQRKGYMDKYPFLKVWFMERTSHEAKD